ncbi:hypothetical protein [Pendulispora albinea]|uniref:Secreted protein n=1 Tax=Pendulispora albinea TaxID=2741071 RepID=A0ABZ2M4N1_9BACT
MNIRKFVPWVITAATVGLPAVTLASDADPIQREQASIARFSAANVMAERHGRYVQARAMALDGAGSVSARTGAWLEKTQNYIVEWTKVLALADLRANIPYAEFESQLTKELDEQSKTLSELGEEAQRIGKLADSALSLIANPEAIPPFAESAQYASVLDTLPVREQEVRTTLTEVGQTANARLERLGTVDTNSRKAVIGRLKVALLATGRYPLEQTLSQVDALLAAEKVVDPILARLNQGFTKMNGYNVNLAYFHAVQAIGPLRQDCASAETALNGMSSPASFISAAKTRRQQLCSGIEQLYTSLTGDTSITKAEYVGEYLTTEKTRLGAVCPRTVSSPPCEKLALLAALSPADLGKMDDARLQFVELGWSEAMDRAQGK